MTSTPNTQAGAEPRSTLTRFGIPVREVRLLARIALLRVLAASPLPDLAKRIQPAGDLILCLHNVVEEHGPLGVNRGLDLTVTELEAVLAYLRAEGYRSAPLADISPDGGQPRPPGEKRFVVTFDDGYAGNLHVAYPLLRRHGVPFTVYVTTGFMDRQVRVWWYALERLLAETDSVTFRHDGGVYDFRIEGHRQKVRAYRAIRQLLLTVTSPAADRILEQLFAGRVADLKELGDTDVLTAEQVRLLARDPLVTIGAHTVSHPVLRQLSEDACRREIEQCRARLMSVTGAAIDHFAYPFGNRAACGPREARLARESGYATAATTRARGVDAADTATALPRIMLTAELDVIAELRALMTGWFGRGR